MADTERRKHPRFSIGAPVSFSGHTVKGSGQALELSMGGCRIGSEHSPQDGDYLELTLTFPGSGEPLMIDSAVVRWVKGRVFGLEFLYMSTEATDRLNRLIQRLRRQMADKDPTGPAGRP